MKTSDAIFDILKKYVDTVFFVPGGGAMHLVDSLGKSGLRHISALHEQGAGFMACGYAQQRNGLGLCLRGVQEVDIINLVKPITKRAYRLIFANHMIGGDVRDDIRELAELCM